MQLKTRIIKNRMIGFIRLFPVISERTTVFTVKE